MQIQAVEVKSDSKRFCYSAYNLQQFLNLSVHFGQEIENQKIKVDTNIHIREIPISKKNLPVTEGSDGPARNIRGYVFLVRPNASSVNGVSMDMAQRYDHPFLVLMDTDSGELIDLKSTNTNRDVLNEYLSFFDIFQYSDKAGKYQYRNGNGVYQAQINLSKENPEQISKENTGYVKVLEKNKPLVLSSLLSITLDKTRSECFYKDSKGVEVFNQTLAADAYVNGKATLTTKSDVKRSLPSSHFFYTLSDNLESWPSFKKPETITKKEAFTRLPFLMTKLSSLTSDKTKFVEALLLERTAWPYLSDYILENGISNETSMKLFWALDRINSTDSVSALASLATSPLEGRELFRAALALGSTSAPFDQEGMTKLQNHMLNFPDPGTDATEHLAFIRMLGAMADERVETAPSQSDELKYFLYSQTNVHDESVNAAVIDAIGNLGETIDPEGKNILLDGLSKDSSKVRLSAASAFKRIPYDTEYTNQFINQLASEKDLQIKNEIVEVLGQTNKSDLAAKDQLLSLLEDPKLSNKSLESLKNINYKYRVEDINLLESKLSQETNKANQRLLASLILKFAREQD